jgi:murein L,D-transpeptidase YcbB/YkuD
MSKQIVPKILCLALAASVIATVSVDSAVAQRKTLLEQWFPKAAERAKERQRLRQLALTGNDGLDDPEPIKKISGPSYYTYKTENLAVVNLASKLPIAEADMTTTDQTGSEPVQKAEVAGEAATAPETPADGDKLIAAVSQVLDSDGESLENGTAATLDAASPSPIDAAQTNAVGVAKPHFTAASLEGWEFKTEADIAAAIEAYYSKNPDYLWIGNDGRPNFWADGMMELFQHADRYGLDPQDYLVESRGLESVDATVREKAAARFELLLSAAALRYAADAKNGRINPNLISGYHDFPNYKRDYSGYLEMMAGSMDPAIALEQLNPKNVRFTALKQELANLRIAANENAIEPVAAGTFFKPGETNGELPKIIAAINKRASAELKTAHAETLAAYTGSDFYAESLVALIRDFQKENGLSADGIVGKNTIAKLQLASPKAKIEKIEIAMEQLRWLPTEFGQRHVFINQPAYTASYIVNDKAQLTMRAIVGQPSNQTSFFYDTIELVEVNPYWNVPRSILQNEMLGKIRQDPGYLSARNYEVVAANGKPQDPYSVDWNSASGPKNVYIRQRPGDSNALGELKILFPNKHAIYMHDTPSRGLFERSSRALSHGCIRLQKPRDMAAAVLQTSVEQIGTYIAGGANQTIKVENQLPVYISYFTAWPKDDGSIDYFADIYGRDAAMMKALNATTQMREKTGLAAG